MHDQRAPGLDFVDPGASQIWLETAQSDSNTDLMSIDTSTCSSRLYYARSFMFLNLQQLCSALSRDMDADTSV